MNCFPRKLKHRGLPDCIHVHGGNSSSSYSSSSAAPNPISAPSLPNLSSSAAGCPNPPPNTNLNFNTAPNNQIGSIATQPPIAYPYNPPQEGEESNGSTKLTVMTGYNQNKTGIQTIGNVRVGNRSTDSGSEVASPLTFSGTIIAGHNTNDSGSQQVGDIEIGNVDWIMESSFRSILMKELRWP